MRKKIFASLMTLLFTTLLFFSLLWGLTFSRELKNLTVESLRDIRVTLLAMDGEVLFDNVYDGINLENHLEREEVKEAMELGKGESRRYSSTNGETTYYYAVKLQGDKILRMSLQAGRLDEILYKFVPLLVLCFLISLAIAASLANRLTKKIVNPINNMDLDSMEVGEYEELAPFVRKIQAQKSEIVAHIQEADQRSSTILSITKNMREGLLLLDQEGIILSSNPSADQIFGSDEARGRNVIELCRDVQFIENVRLSCAGEKKEMDLPVGHEIYKVLFSPVYQGKAISGVGIFLIDITEKYYFEQRRKEFTANVSHELKTPLTSIIGYSEMLASGAVKAQDIEPFAKKIHLQSVRLQNIINDIISLSEFDEGKKPKEFAAVNLYELVQNVMGNLEDKAREKKVRLALMGLKELRIQGNARLLDSMVFNLLDNAIKYNKEGGEVEITLAEEGDYAKLLVSDTGIGIPAAHKNRIFERFYLVDKSRSKSTGGTGLGLAIVKHIAEFHNGSVKIQSKEGVGTTFTCYLKK